MRSGRLRKVTPPSLCVPKIEPAKESMFSLSSAGRLLSGESSLNAHTFTHRLLNTVVSNSLQQSHGDHYYSFAQQNGHTGL